MPSGYSRSTMVRRQAASSG